MLNYPLIEAARKSDAVLVALKEVEVDVSSAVVEELERKSHRISDAL